MTYRQTALDHAAMYVGVHEVPAGSNKGPHINGWLKDAGVPPGNPWCMAFIHGMFLEAGYTLGGGASVGNFEAWARAHHYVWASVPKPGDIACYEWEHDNWPDHVGIVHHVAVKHSRIVHWDGTVEPVRKGDVIAIEGNTSIGNDSDGGRVMYRSRKQVLCTFARIP